MHPDKPFHSYKDDHPYSVTCGHLLRNSLPNNRHPAYDLKQKDNYHDHDS